MNHAQAAESDRRLERLLMLSKRLLDWDAAADEVLLLEETDELLELYKLVSNFRPNNIFAKKKESPSHSMSC